MCVCVCVCRGRGVDRLLIGNSLRYITDYHAFQINGQMK